MQQQMQIKLLQFNTAVTVQTNKGIASLISQQQKMSGVLA
jgi:hypothetical protein